MKKKQIDWLRDKLSVYTGRATFGRMTADLSDLTEICRWYLDTMEQTLDHELSDDELETFLIQLETKFIDHANFHLRSLKKDVERILRKIPEN